MMKASKNPIFLVPLLCLGSCAEQRGIAFHSNVEDHVFHTVYEDSFFLHDSALYQPSLSLASHATAMATIRSDVPYERRGGFLSELWEKEGFGHVYLNEDFTKKPTLDSIGYGFAYKEVTGEDPFRLVAIAVRSGAYGGEWANNITLGAEGDAKGFSDSADTLLQDLRRYLGQEGIQGKTKFWLSGYSRGGCVANLASGRLVDDIAENAFLPGIKSSVDDVYAYCFEPPCCAHLTSSADLHHPRYAGIKNILNFNDFVVHLLPYGWGFDRYGEDLYYPDRLTDIRFCVSGRKKVISDYHFTLGGHKYPSYAVDEWKFYDVGGAEAKEFNLPRLSFFPSPGRFARFFSKSLGEAITRDFYARGIENGLRDLMAAFLGLNPVFGENLISANALLDIIGSYPFISNLATAFQQGDVASFALDASFVLQKIFATDEKTYAEARALCDGNKLLFFVLPYVFNSRQDLALQFLSRENLTKLINSHYTELNYSFTRCCDPRFYGEDALSLNDGSYYRFHVKSPGKLEIRESSLGCILTFDGTNLSSPYLSCERMDDGTIDVYMPKNGDYAYACASEDIALFDVDGFGRETLVRQTMPESGRL